MAESTQTLQPRVAISKSYLEAYAALPKKIQKKAREFGDKFLDNPKSSAINYEKLPGLVRDEKIRSVRIDQTYRAIVVEPPRASDVHLLVWVDHHDQAYRWAKDKVFEVNEHTGSMQVYTATEELIASREAKKRQGFRQADLFAELSDDDLLSCGVPQILLPALRRVVNEHELFTFVEYLPDEAADALLMVAAGSTVEEALDDVTAERVEAVDPADFGAALERAESRRAFALVESDEALAAMLDQPLDAWRVFLHPSQRSLVRMNANGPVRVLGGPGTGKTVVLLHRARYLAEEVHTAETDRLLVTTFTANLARDLEVQLRKLCEPATLTRIEVRHFHGWLARYMREHGKSFDLASSLDQAIAWNVAFSRHGDASLGRDFYREEWADVVQPQRIRTRRDYFAAHRAGRRIALNRRQRAEAWKVFEAYRAELDDKNRVEWADVAWDALDLLTREGPSFRAILVDEAQDFSQAELELVRAMAPRAPGDLFLVGDAHQRIYGHPTRFSSCGIDIIGRGRRLKLNYRTTEQIARVACALMAGVDVDDLDGRSDTLAGYHSLRTGEEPIRLEVTANDWATAVTEAVTDALQHHLAEEICVAAATNEAASDARGTLEAAGIGAVVVDTRSDEELEPGVRIATFHRTKGLEFGTMILCIDRNAPPAPALHYVAATRARDRLVEITCS